MTFLSSLTNSWYWSKADTCSSLIFLVSKIGLISVITSWTLILVTGSSIDFCNSSKSNLTCLNFSFKNFFNLVESKRFENSIGLIGFCEQVGISYTEWESLKRFWNKAGYILASPALPLELLFYTHFFISEGIKREIKSIFKFILL